MGPNENTVHYGASMVQLAPLVKLATIVTKGDAGSPVSVAVKMAIELKSLDTPTDDTAKGSSFNVDSVNTVAEAKMPFLVVAMRVCAVQGCGSRSL
eukprot:222890-Prymnesium_polylepis.1